MGKNLIITYDLNSPAQNYDLVIDVIKQLGAWAHVQQSVWYVNSELSAEEAANQVLRVLDADDSLLVIDATSNAAAWHNLSDRVSAFLGAQWQIRRAA